MRRQILTLGLIGLLMAATAPTADAQMRRWAGIGMAAAGGVLAALTPTKCRVTGALGEDAFDIVFSNRVGDVAVLFDNPRSAVTESSDRSRPARTPPATHLRVVPESPLLKHCGRSVSRL